MNILFYSPLQGRSKDTESIMEAFVKHGEKVYLLTQYESEIYHSACTRVGVQCFSTAVAGTASWLKKWKQVVFLISFCKEKKIDIVYAQLEPATFIAVLAQYFTKSKIVLVRHHVDLLEMDSTKLGHWISILTYKLSHNVVVVSNKAKEYMISREGINPEKIKKINLGFNFSLWPSIDVDFVKHKRESIKCDFVLVTAARLVKSKRIDTILQIVKKLRKKGYDCGLLVLGDGDELANLKRLALELNIADHVLFEGYVETVTDYVAASDMMIHLSLTESSATVVKEAGLARKPVIVCEGVGDFSDYIQDGVNGFLVDRLFPMEEAIGKITNFINNKNQYSHLGENLHNSVINFFSIDKIYPEYHRLNSEAN